MRYLLMFLFLCLPVMASEPCDEADNSTGFPVGVCAPDDDNKSTNIFAPEQKSSTDTEKDKPQNEL